MSSERPETIDELCGLVAAAGFCHVSLMVRRDDFLLVHFGIEERAFRPGYARGVIKHPFPWERWKWWYIDEIQDHGEVRWGVGRIDMTQIGPAARDDILTRWREHEEAYPRYEQARQLAEKQVAEFRERVVREAGLEKLRELSSERRRCELRTIFQATPPPGSDEEAINEHS